MGMSKVKGGMGFRDLVVFNKALLAKQVWRLYKYPDSLVGQIYKAKYYPNSTVLEASRGKKNSLIWRSLMASQEVIVRGAMWRVGDGRSIKVKGDRWIPVSSSYSIQSPCRILPEGALVADLIDRGAKVWKSSLIKEAFNEDEAKVILNIPLSSSLPQDRLIWRGTVNGEFSVRGAYHMEMEWHENQKGSTSNPGDVEEIWKTVWKLKVPNAVKMFIWKAGHNILPTKANLLRRGVIKEAMCPICLRETETVEHILWECASSNDVWGCGPVRIQKSSCKGGNFLHLLEEVRARCERRDVELFAIMARRIWLRRNDVVHGGDLLTQRRCSQRP
jgi:hypothetical protein